MRAQGPALLGLFALALGCSATLDDSPKPAAIDAGEGPSIAHDAGTDAAKEPPRERDAGADVAPYFPDSSPGEDAAPFDRGDLDGGEEDASLDAGFEEALDAPDVSLDAAEDVSEDAEGDAPAAADGGDVPDASDGGDTGSDAGDGGDSDDAEPDASEVVVPDEPSRLEEAGLYSDFDGRALAQGNRFYEPAFKLWSDGAEKERYVYLPPGSTIDARDPDRWRLPEGTRLYKHFRIDGRLIETRFLQKLSTGWFAATYAWNAEGSATVRVTKGARNVFGTGYDIPDQTTCEGCHRGASDMALGFELIGLANEGASGLDLQALNAEGLLSPPLMGDYTVPGSALDREALGWLHANCGTACHNGLNPLAKGYWTGFWMLLHSRELHSVETTATWRTGAFVTSDFQPGGPLLHRISPGSPDKSAIVYRTERRGSTEQMPPMDSNQVDEEGVAMLRAWIESLQ